MIIRNRAIRDPGTSIGVIDTAAISRNRSIRDRRTSIGVIDTDTSASPSQYRYRI